MSDIFSNANCKVERFSVIKGNPKEIDLASDSFLANSKLREMSEASKTIDFDAEMEQMAKDHMKEKSRNAVIERSIHESQIDHKFEQMSKKCKTDLFKDILFEVFSNALPLDATFLKEHSGNLKYLINGYVNDNNGFDLLESAIEKHDSVLLKRMKKLCKETADNVTRSRLLESNCKEDITDIDFRLKPEEKKEFDMGKNELDLEKISDMVKNKVLTVVKDEKARQTAEAEIRTKIEEEIQAELTDKMDEEVETTNADGEEVEPKQGSKFNKDQDDLHESLSRIVVQESPIEKGTLFNALMRSTYHEMIQENVAIQNEFERVDDRRDDFSDHYDVNYSMRDEFEKHDPLDDGEDEPIEHREINMDLILAEALTKYALMEMLHTLKLEDYTYENMSKLTERLLNDIDSSMSPVMEAKGKDDEERISFFKIKGDFFKSFNNIKDQKHIEKSKKELLSLASRIEEKDKKHLKKVIDGAVSQMETVAEKNPHMKEHCDSVIEWLKGTLTDAISSKAEPEETDEEKEVKEMWDSIF